MIPKIRETSDPVGRVDFWPNQEQKLESVHSPEAFEMIQSHLSLVLGERLVGPLDTIIQISKIKLGKLYAASIMYDSLIRIPPNDDGTVGESFMDGGEGKSYRLRSYVMYLDAETLQRYATIRSKEAISLIEKQTQALFGRPDIRVLEDGSIDTSKDEVISVTFLGLTMLVLEAVAFGSFMWDSESYVESKYPFIKS
ncbi:hypothetical protein CISIN_1g036217mg [Citrus sinensis]|uniref:Uncharacterized protein n=1 Tax=Citrus sinensis TaxID=2711 RepID=A0A067EQ44_CITSI|nr:hypothetical protein CISIN_1g036217mg [Citrus sinensis]